MTLKYIWRSFQPSLGCHFHVHLSYFWHAFASHGLPAIAELVACRRCTRQKCTVKITNVSLCKWKRVRWFHLENAPKAGREENGKSRPNVISKSRRGGAYAQSPNKKVLSSSLTDRNLCQFYSDGLECCSTALAWWHASWSLTTTLIGDQLIVCGQIRWSHAA